MRYSHYQAKDYFDAANEFNINRSSENPIDQCCYHSHDFVEICYVSAGKGMHLVNGRQYSVARGDLFIIQHDVRHAFIKEESDPEELIVYNVLFKPAFIDRVMAGIDDLAFSLLPTSHLFLDIEPANVAKANIRLSIEDQKEFDDLLCRMYREFSVKPNGYFSMLRAYMIQLIVMIVRCLSKQESYAADAMRDGSLIQKIMLYLEEHYSEKFDLNGIALKSFFSKGYLCRVFKESTGMTMSEYVQKLRINEACSLILRSDIKLTDVAYKVGFSDYKAYIATFKKITGKTPHQYRAENTAGGGQ